MDASRLKSIPLFEEVPEEELGQIATFAQEVSVDQGRELVREGDFSYEFMAIEEGQAEVTRDGDHVADLGPGDFFGEMGLLEKTLRNATVTAKTPMKLVTLTGWDLKRMERHIPEAIERVRAMLEERRPGGLRRRGGANRPVRRHRLHRPAGGRGDGRARAAARARGAHPVEAGRAGRRAGRRSRDADRRRVRPAERARRWSSAATCSSRPSARSRAGARPPRRPPPRSRRALHRLDRRAGVHPRGVRALRAARRAGGHRDAHRDGLRLGAGQPRRRRSRSTAPASWPTRVDVGYFITGRRRPAERGHAGLARSGPSPRPLRLPRRRVQTERGAKRVRSFRVGSKDLSADLGRAAPSTSRCPASRPGCAR